MAAGLEHDGACLRQVRTTRSSMAPIDGEQHLPAMSPSKPFEYDLCSCHRGPLSGHACSRTEGLTTRCHPILRVVFAGYVALPGVHSR